MFHDRTYKVKQWRWSKLNIEALVANFCLDLRKAALYKFNSEAFSVINFCYQPSDLIQRLNEGSMMIEIIFYGRGGQGVVVASKTLAAALFHEGLYVQSFPAFGGERRGAPVKAFLRADKKAIRRRSLIYKADHAIVLDETLFDEMPIQNEAEGALSIVINSANPVDRFKGLSATRVGTVDANAIAKDLGLGTDVMPVVNTTMLGAFAKVSRTVEMNSLAIAIGKNITIKAESNISGADKAYHDVTEIKGGIDDQP